MKALGATKITICSESAQLETFLSRLFNLNGIAVEGKWAPEQYCIVKLWNWNTVYRVNDAQRSIRRLNEAQRKTKSLVQLKHLFLRVLRTNILDAQSKHRHWHMSGIGFCVKPGWLIERWIRYFSDSEPKCITQTQRNRPQKMWVVFYEVCYNQLEIYLAIYALNFNE